MPCDDQAGRGLPQGYPMVTPLQPTRSLFLFFSSPPLLLLQVHFRMQQNIILPIRHPRRQPLCSTPSTSMHPKAGAARVEEHKAADRFFYTFYSFFAKKNPFTNHAAVAFLLLPHPPPPPLLTLTPSRYGVHGVARCGSHHHRIVIEIIVSWISPSSHVDEAAAAAAAVAYSISLGACCFVPHWMAV